MILVKDSTGKMIRSFAPNFIGSTSEELMSKANEIARIHNGTISVSFWN